MEKEPSTKFSDVLIRFHEVMKLQSFGFSVSDVIHANVKSISPLFFCIFLLVLWKKKTSVKSNGLFVHLSWAYEVAKFWVVKRYLDVSDVIHANEQTKPANCGLHVNFWRMLFCYFVLWRKRFILRKSCYFGLRSPKFPRRFV